MARGETAGTSAAARSLQSTGKLGRAGTGVSTAAAAAPGRILTLIALATLTYTMHFGDITTHTPVMSNYFSLLCVKGKSTVHVIVCRHRTSRFCLQACLAVLKLCLFRTLASLGMETALRDRLCHRGIEHVGKGLKGCSRTTVPL